MKTFNCGGSRKCSSGSVHYHYSGEHRSMQADVVLQLRILHLDPEATESQPTDTMRKTLQKGIHKDTLPPANPYLIIMPLSFEVTVFKPPHPG